MDIPPAPPPNFKRRINFGKGITSSSLATPRNDISFFVLSLRVERSNLLTLERLPRPLALYSHLLPTGQERRKGENKKYRYHFQPALRWRARHQDAGQASFGWWVTIYFMGIH